MFPLLPVLSRFIVLVFIFLNFNPNHFLSRCSNGANINVTSPILDMIVIGDVQFTVNWIGSLLDSNCPVVIASTVGSGLPQIINPNTSDDGLYIRPVLCNSRFTSDLPFFLQNYSFHNT